MPATPAGPTPLPTDLPVDLPFGHEHVQTLPCGCWTSTDWADLFAEMLDEKGEHVAAGYVRSMTARDPDGIAGVRTEPPTGVIDMRGAFAAVKTLPSQPTPLGRGRRRRT